MRRKLRVQVGPYLLNIGVERHWWRVERYKHHRMWCVFFGIGSLARWPWLDGFKIGLVK